ncbi:MAG: SUMF1/EgtB/PvdO family nonheme iron enzyme [Burkholderiaceae bacterium]|nr:SUMF1/EgtB/PvdO family nonheme iron enzyme [Burkholderiaceae bacterium]
MSIHDRLHHPEAALLRQGDAAALGAALAASRADTLATFEAWRRALPELAVPLRDALNPPLWELGHIGWFEAFWLARNPERHRGVAADPEAPRPDSLRPGGDALYNSSRVPHDSRWALPLPDASATLDDLARQRAQTQGLLAQLGPGCRDDAALYFFRLALAHEDMHHEAALYMAQSLGLPMADVRWQAARLRLPRQPIRMAAQRWRLGWAGPGFAFDNELQAQERELDGFEIDSRVLTWAEFLPFVEAGGYRQPQWWDEAGRAWLRGSAAEAPRYLRCAGSGWQQWRHGAWRALPADEPACHLTCFEAEAWCAWAGRRLPTEAEWECAALGAPQRFRHGDVWEWTASNFEPFAGFERHPYRDYSAPWFGGSRRVLRGGSFMTQPRLRHPRYRNFFPPGRSDVPAGFRTCARQGD